MRTWPRFIMLCVALLAPAVHAGDPFTETNDDEPCCDLEDNHYLQREILLGGVGPFFTRSELTDFADEFTLPVENGDDIELVWDNGALGRGSSLCLTLDDEAGNFHNEHVKITTDFAIQGDLAAAMAQAGVVVRHTGEEDFGDHKFYCVYGEVLPGGALGLQIRFHLVKWFGTSFVTLDSGAADSGPYDFSATENFRLSLEVTERDVDNNFQLTASFERLSVVDGALVVEHLGDLDGTDRALGLGQPGVYAGAGSVHTQIAFDNCALALLGGPVPTRTSTWGALKAVYR